MLVEVGSLALSSFQFIFACMHEISIIFSFWLTESQPAGPIFWPPQLDTRRVIQICHFPTTPFHSYKW